MTDSTLVFVEERSGRPELVVNFGIHAARQATEAEIVRLGHRLLEDVAPVEILSEQRYEFDREAEATVYQVRVRLPASAGGEEDALLALVQEWAEDCIGERRLTP